MSWGVLYIIPPVLAWNSISNADSLVLLDVANDIWTGKSLYGWNFPRAPYIFPDLLIATLVMSFGWSSSYTLLLIATTNYLLFIFVAQRIVNSIYGTQYQSILSTALSISAALIFFGIMLFPIAIHFIYWQLFASGAHFLSAIIIALIFSEVSSNRSIKLNQSTLLWIIVLVFLVSVSNSISILLIGSWLFARVGWGCVVRFSGSRSDILPTKVEIYIALSLMSGTFIGSSIPRQSIADSFLSLQNFIVGIEGFCAWLMSSFENALLVVALLFLVIAWSYISTLPTKAGVITLPSDLKKRGAFFQSPYLLPSLSIFVVAPFLYQGESSLRYFAFPGFIALICISVFFSRAFSCLSNISKFGFGLVFVTGILACAIGSGRKGAYFLGENLTTTTHQMHDGMFYPSDAQFAIQCIQKASALYPLQDGLATYWNARPIRVASHFKYYLAQVSSWNPPAGYFLWGNNGMDFLYSDISSRELRKYNYIVASNMEIDSGVWGNTLDHASNQVTCEGFSIFIFSSQNTLDDYLFPGGKPNYIDGRGAIK